MAYCFVDIVDTSRTRHSGVSIGLPVRSPSSYSVSIHRGRELERQGHLMKCLGAKQLQWKPFQCPLPLPPQKGTADIRASYAAVLVPIILPPTQTDRL